MGFKAVAKHAPVYVTAKIFAAQDTAQLFFIADRTYEVVSIAESHSAGDAAGTAVIEKVPSGTAIGSGIDLHSTAFDLNSTANTPIIKEVGTDLVESASVRTLSRGDALGIDFGGTLNDTYQGVFVVGLKPLPGQD